MNERSTEWPPDRTTVGWRIAQVIGSLVAAFLGVFALGYWWHSVSFNFTATRAPNAGIETGIMVLGFLIWFVPTWIAIGILAAVFGLRHLAFKIAASVGGLMTIVAVVSFFLIG